MSSHETIPERDALVVTNQLSELTSRIGSLNSMQRLQRHQRAIENILEQPRQQYEILSRKFMSPQELLEYGRITSFIEKGEHTHNRIQERIQSPDIPVAFVDHISETHEQFQGILQQYHVLMEESKIIGSQGPKEERSQREQLFINERLHPFYHEVTKRLVQFDEELKVWSDHPQIRNYLQATGLVTEQDIERWSVQTNITEKTTDRQHDASKKLLELLESGTIDAPIQRDEIVAALYPTVDPTKVEGRLSNLLTYNRRKLLKDGINIVNKHPRGRNQGEYYLEHLVSHEEHELFQQLEIAEETMLHLYGNQLRVKDIVVDLNSNEASVLYRLAKNGKEAHIETIAKNYDITDSNAFIEELQGKVNHLYTEPLIYTSPDGKKIGYNSRIRFRNYSEYSQVPRTRLAALQYVYEQMSNNESVSLNTLQVLLGPSKGIYRNSEPLSQPKMRQALTNALVFLKNRQKSQQLTVEETAVWNTLTGSDPKNSLKHLRDVERFVSTNFTVLPQRLSIEAKPAKDLDIELFGGLTKRELMFIAYRLNFDQYKDYYNSVLVEKRNETVLSTGLLESLSTMEENEYELFISKDFFRNYGLQNYSRDAILKLFEEHVFDKLERIINHPEYQEHFDTIFADNPEISEFILCLWSINQREVVDNYGERKSGFSFIRELYKDTRPIFQGQVHYRLVKQEQQQMSILPQEQIPQSVEIPLVEVGEHNLPMVNEHVEQNKELYSTLDEPETRTNGSITEDKKIINDLTLLLEDIMGNKAFTDAVTEITITNAYGNIKNSDLSKWKKGGWITSEMINGRDRYEPYMVAVMRYLKLNPNLKPQTKKKVEKVAKKLWDNLKRK